MPIAEKGEAALAEVRKFPFDVVFDAAGGSSLLKDSAAKRFSQSDLDAARAEGEAAGRADALAQAERAIEAQLKGCANAAAQLCAALDAELAALRQEAAMLALAMARKAAGRALEEFGVARAVDAFDVALEGLSESARLVVRLAPGALERARPRLQEAAKAHGFEGVLVLRPLPGAGPGDITIEWGDGAVCFSGEALLARFEAAISEHDWGSGPAAQEEPGR